MSEEKKEEEPQNKITDEEKENMCALEYDIKKKGEMLIIMLINPVLKIKMSIQMPKLSQDQG